MGKHRGLWLGAAVVLAITLVGCTDALPPSQPSGSASPTSSGTPKPTASVTPTSTPSPASPPPPSTPPPPANPAPGQVVGLTAVTGGGSGEVLLRWTQNPESDVVSYIVLRASTPGGSLTRIGTVTPYDVTLFEYVPFVDSEAVVNYYRVRAVDSANQQGPLSAEVCGASYGHRC